MFNKRPLFVYSLVLLFSLPQLSHAWPFEGFTEPDLAVAVAMAEPGILAKVEVKAGDQIKNGQKLAQLDNQVLNASLNVAKAKAAAKGAVVAAKARQRLHQQRLNRLLPLLSRGLAQQAEIDDTRADLAVAKAEVKTAKEQQYINSLSVKQIQAQINRRILRSPLDGVVTEVHKEVAEWVGGNEPAVMTVARVNPLRLSLQVPTTTALSLQEGDSLKVEFSALPELGVHQSQIDFISPITDAGSDTVEVRLKLDNQTGKLRSGLKCLVHDVEASPVPEQ